ncbi:SpoIIE family protein phosphatase [Oscillatoria sp. FACHB-1406]|uniref:protein kinase domain-containing protein n=1 Tax=Oscillatoria sp. FACHB-1406 TaxID=2692846 RepID=UPI0016874CCF|nr:SpoIIE family protein phosphatase [Oscillatoria sp. FACHB-1406]MBD2576413.1 SpoIIE family protein phosphatase [Oscillatoria sp. FACHB-1406]
MKFLQGYQLTQQIHEGLSTAVYRGIRERDGKLVTLKMSRHEYPNVAVNARLKHEYEILKGLSLKGSIRAYALENDNHRLAIVFENSTGISLRRYCRLKTIDLRLFLKIAIAIVSALQELHHHKIIHRDIKPDNIIIEPQTAQIKLVDFGLAARFSAETNSFENPQAIVGSWPYISPEQTGRINRTVDRRTDYYSLGVTLYEILLKERPFLTNDPLEMVHCHLARQPILPHEKKPSIPLSVSEIVMKLLSKTVESRYQTAFGILADLKKCYERLSASGQIAPFPIGIVDDASRFVIPQKLYGRELEFQRLNARLERFFLPPPATALTSPPASRVLEKQLPQFILIKGEPGAGKSYLVNQFFERSKQHQCFFIEGKFEQLQPNTPYACLIQAFRVSIDKLLAQNQATLEKWKGEFEQALGVHGQLIVDVIPELEMIIGKQRSVPSLKPNDSLNRFNSVFKKFVRVFARPEHPLILFLDDLQWADTASLSVIRVLLSGLDNPHFLLLGTVRDNEVQGEHPLQETLDGISEIGVKIEEIELSPLSFESTLELIVETLQCDRDRARPLAQLCQQKTNGNPFFLNQILKSFYQQGIFEYNSDRGSWNWNIRQIEQVNISENVVEFVSQKLEKFSECHKQLLGLASCIGSQFDGEMLAELQNNSHLDIEYVLYKSLQEGLIIDLKKLGRVGLGGEESSTSLFSVSQRVYQFSHDRIQQVCSAFLSEEQRCVNHAKIGRWLLAKSSDRELEEKLFKITRHWNAGEGALTSLEDYKQLMLLNYRCGVKAKKSTAFASARDYFALALTHSPVNSWSEERELTFVLHRDLAECEYLCNNLERADELLQVALKHAQTILEEVELQEILCALYSLRGQYRNILKTGASYLDRFGIHIPLDNPELLQKMLAEYFQWYREVFEKIEVVSLADLPEMVDSRMKACVGLLNNMTPAAYFCDRHLLALIGLKLLQITYEYGNARNVADAYAAWGVVLSAQLQEYKAGYEFGKLAVALNKRQELVSHSFNLFGALIAPWRQSLKQNIPILRAAFKAGAELRDLQTSFGASHLISQRIVANEDLESILEEINEHIEFFRKTHDLVFLATIQIKQHFLLNLKGQTFSKFSLSSEGYDEQQGLEIWQKANFTPGIAQYWMYKAKVAFLYGDYSQAVTMGKMAVEQAIFVRGSILQAEPYFDCALSITAIFKELPSEEKPEYWQLLETCHRTYELWAENCPDNFLNRLLLIEAEIWRIQGRLEEAMELYDRAIASAKDNGFLLNEAIANELAAKFWLNRQKPDFARLYACKAYYIYQQWGALRKVEDLEARYPEWFLSPTVPQKGEITLQTPSNHDKTPQIFDTAVVTQAALAISSEIEIEKLLEKLMQLAIENAGAQRGFLIVAEGQDWRVQASGIVDRALKIEVLQNLEIASGEMLPLSILQYVQRTREDVVLADARQDPRYRDDPYIQQAQPKSVLVAPILDRGKVSAIVYLENNHTTHVFVRDRVEVIKVLAAQAAISIDKARLYQNLEQKVAERTAELAAANEEITLLNERLENENMRMSTELDVAKALQFMVLPTAEELQAIPNLDIAGFMEPADDVGGDYYDVWQYDGGVKIALGDVTGHGLESGAIMMMVQTAARSIHNDGQSDPVQFINILNRTLFDNIQRMRADKSMTLILLDYRDGMLQFSGQHEEVIIVRADGTLERFDTIDLGFPLALEREISNFVGSNQTPLNSGDVVLLYSDGITEAFDLENKEYGIERLCEVLLAHHRCTSEEICQAIVEDVRRYIGKQKVFDDITMVAIKVKE